MYWRYSGDERGHFAKWVGAGGLRPTPSPLAPRQEFLTFNYIPNDRKSCRLLLYTEPTPNNAKHSYSTVLHKLQHTILIYTTVSYTIPHYPTLLHSLLHYATLSYTTLHSPILYHTVLYYATFSYTVPHSYTTIMNI